MFCVFCFTVVISEREGGIKKPGHGTCNTHSSSTDNNGVSSKGVPVILCLFVRFFPLIVSRHAGPILLTRVAYQFREFATSYPLSEQVIV